MTFHNIAKSKGFPWPHMDRSTWPGREVYWAWRNPTISLFILINSMLSIACVIRGF